MGNSAKSLTKVKISNSHGSPLIQQPVISSQKATRLVKHDLLFINPC